MLHISVLYLLCIPCFAVVALGDVEWLHPAFHNEKAIFPPGYRAERLARESCLQTRCAVHGTSSLASLNGPVAAAWVPDASACRPETSLLLNSHDSMVQPSAFTPDFAGTPASGGKEVMHVMEVCRAPNGSGPLFRCACALCCCGAALAAAMGAGQKRWPCSCLGKLV